MLLAHFCRTMTALKQRIPKIAAKNGCSFKKNVRMFENIKIDFETELKLYEKNFPVSIKSLLPE